MAKHVSVFIATSLDGYIATREDSLAWLTRVEGEGDNGYADFYQTVDTVVMGRRTYDWLLKEVGREGFPYRDKACYVYTKQQTGTDGLVQFVNEQPDVFLSRFSADTGKALWLVGGAGLIESFLQQRLVDEWIVTIAPVLLGDGIPLFSATIPECRLELLDCKRYGQFASMHYRVIAPKSDAE